MIHVSVVFLACFSFIGQIQAESAEGTSLFLSKPRPSPLKESAATLLELLQRDVNVATSQLRDVASKPGSYVKKMKRKQPLNFDKVDSTAELGSRVVKNKKQNKKGKLNFDDPSGSGGIQDQSQVTKNKNSEDHQLNEARDKASSDQSQPKKRKEAPRQCCCPVGEYWEDIETPVATNPKQYLVWKECEDWFEKHVIDQALTFFHCIESPCAEHRSDMKRTGDPEDVDDVETHRSKPDDAWTNFASRHEDPSWTARAKYKLKASSLVHMFETSAPRHSVLVQTYLDLYQDRKDTSVDVLSTSSNDFWRQFVASVASGFKHIGLPNQENYLPGPQDIEPVKSRAVKLSRTRSNRMTILYQLRTPDVTTAQALKRIMEANSTRLAFQGAAQSAFNHRSGIGPIRMVQLPLVRVVEKPPSESENLAGMRNPDFKHIT